MDGLFITEVFLLVAMDGLSATGVPVLVVMDELSLTGVSMVIVTDDVMVPVIITDKGDTPTTYQNKSVTITEILKSVGFL